MTFKLTTTKIYNIYLLLLHGQPKHNNTEDSLKVDTRSNGGGGGGGGRFWGVLEGVAECLRENGHLEKKERGAMWLLERQGR